MLEALASARIKVYALMVLPFWQRMITSVNDERKSLEVLGLARGSPVDLMVCEKELDDMVQRPCFRRPRLVKTKN